MSSCRGLGDSLAVAEDSVGKEHQVARAHDGVGRLCAGFLIPDIADEKFGVRLYWLDVIDGVEAILWNRV
jgi:hypothetical protein